MQYNFPATKFAKENTMMKQIQHVESEIEEYFNSLGFNEKFEEAIDVYHSLETLFRILERQGTDINLAFEKVQQKNEARGYYELGG